MPAHHPAPPLRVHLTVHGILHHAWPPCEAPRRPARTAACGPVCTRSTYPRLLHHENNTHTWRTDVASKKRRWRRRRKCAVRGTMRYGSQKIRDPDMRARHVSRRINEGAWHPLLPTSPCLLVSRRNLLRKCRYVDEGGSATISPSSRPLIARRVNIRLGDARLDCVHWHKSLSETSLRKSPFPRGSDFPFFKNRTDIYSLCVPLFY